MSGKRWADMAKNTTADDDMDMVLLPPVEEEFNKETGIKHRVEWVQREDEKTKKIKYVKITRKSRFNMVRRRVSKASLVRKDLPRFGAVLAGKGAEKGITMVSQVDIQFEWEHDKKEEEDEDSGIRKMLGGEKQDALLAEIMPTWLKQQENAEKKGTLKKYVPKFSTMNANPMHSQQEENPTIRILDLPRNATFNDIRSLVYPFHSKKVSLPKDSRGEQNEAGDYPNRGFAFVQFASRADGEKAKKALDGHAYGTNIIHVEWSRNYLNYLKEHPPGSAIRRSGRTRYFNSAKAKKKTPGGSPAAAAPAKGPEGPSPGARPGPQAQPGPRPRTGFAAAAAQRRN